jgi:hypothetical protein
VAFGDFGGFATEKSAREYADGYAEGTGVNVSYCLDNPRLSTLRPGLCYRFAWSPIGGLIATLIGLGMLSASLARVFQFCG